MYFISDVVIAKAVLVRNTGTEERSRRVLSINADEKSRKCGTEEVCNFSKHGF